MSSDPIEVLRDMKVTMMLNDYERSALDAALASLSAPKLPQGCGDPECGCGEPSFTEPLEALEFLSERMKAAGIGEAVALYYARDIDAILDRYSKHNPADNMEAGAGHVQGSEWVLVPCEPTTEMFDAGAAEDATTDIWDAMLAAAPKPESAEVAPEGVYHRLRSIRYNATHGSQDRPLHMRLRLIAEDAQRAIDAYESAPPRPESAEAVYNCPTCPVSVQTRWQEPECPECGERCYLDPTAAPAPPRPEASDEDCPKCRRRGDDCGEHWPPDSTAPQQASAPVGVERPARRLLEAYDDNAHPFEAAAAAEELRNALAQQPAPSAPVGVDLDKVAAHLAEHGGDYDELIRLVQEATLAQQPAADEKPVGWWNGILPDVTDRSPYEPSIRWGADAENSGHDIPLYAGVNPSRVQQPAAVDGAMVERFRVAFHNADADAHTYDDHIRIGLTAALAGPQGGNQ